jgi:glycosyltransferase involved in cell wall biosynthesis
LFEVHLYLSDREGELLAGLPADVCIYSPSGRSNSASLWDRLPGTILRRRAAEFADIVRHEQIDVIYDRAFHNTMIAGHPSIQASLQNLGVRRVSTIVSPPHEALPMVEKRFVWAKRRLLAGAYRRSDQVIAVSRATADSAASYYDLPRERIEVIYNPVETAAEFKAEQQFSNHDPLRIVCVGRMTPEKGQADLIAAIDRLRGKWAADLPRLQLRFIGDGPDRTALEQQWSSLAGDEGNVDGHTVEFVGVVSPAIQEIAAADALVLPSRFEGMPNVVLESFAVGTPVLATRSGGTVELQAIADEPTCFWASPNDPDALATGLRELASRPEIRWQHAQTAQALIRSRHSVEATVEKISAILCA